MFFHEILQALQRVETRQQEILERLRAEPAAAREQSARGDTPRPGADEWMQSGINNILAYDAGKKREG